MMYPITISNKEKITPHEYKSEPGYHTVGKYWTRGYSFVHFWSNCAFLLGELSKLNGMQQLVHHYYLQNGSLGCVETVHRIKKFLGIEEQKGGE